MGKFRKLPHYLVGLLGAAAVAFPALASTVSVDVSPTTGYTVTNRTTTALPPRTTSGPIATYNPTLGPLAGGGAYQTTSSGITITGINGNVGSTTMSGRVNATAAAMRNSLTRCLTSFRCNAALAGGAAGVQALFNGIDWVMGEGGAIKKQSAVSNVYNGVPDGYASVNSYSGVITSSGDGRVAVQYAYDIGGVAHYHFCPASLGSYPLTGFVVINSNSRLCYFGGDGYNDGPTSSPVPPSEIPPAVDNNYNPDPSDLPYLNGGFDWSDPGVNFEIMDIPSITGADSPTFIEYPDGTSKGTYSEFDFSWSNNPSKQPNVSVDETTTETTYSETGQPTGTTTTTTTGSGSPANNEIEIPTDCDFMPTVCRFIDWFTEPDPELSQEPDFTQLIDVIEIEREFQVGTSTAACPAPFQIRLAWVPSVEVSLQPFCDLADLLRPLLLSLCFLYSGMIILRT